jgi:hypothetical protein
MDVMLDSTYLFDLRMESTRFKNLFDYLVYRSRQSINTTPSNARAQVLTHRILALDAFFECK